MIATAIVACVMGVLAIAYTCVCVYAVYSPDIDKHTGDAVTIVYPFFIVLWLCACKYLGVII